MKKIDLTGHRFGRLTVMYEVSPYISPNGKKRSKWHCRCDCGKEKDIVGKNLMRGHTQSCGCYNKERIKETHTTHGLSHTWQYRRVIFVINRCYNKNAADYCLYGGRDIYVHKEWKDNPALFAQYLIDKGMRKDQQIDRIDNNKGYEPDNIRFVTNRENALNRRFLQSNNKSGYRGVSWDKKSKKWRAYIQIMGKAIHLGFFKNKHIAASAYNAKAYFHGYPLNKIKEKHYANET